MKKLFHLLSALTMVILLGGRANAGPAPAPAPPSEVYGMGNSRVLGQHLLALPLLSASAFPFG